MLQATSRTVKAFCHKQGLAYEQYVGIKRGYWPWQATFNRLFLFAELEGRGFDGWCIYMDADAYVYDLSFDLKAYLNACSGSALICTPAGSSDLPYDVNIGVLGLNFGHPATSEILARWRAHFDAVPDADLQAGQADWAKGVPDDQVMLQWTLRDNPHLASLVHHSSHTDINSPHARFIRQYLRAFDYDLSSRTRRLQRLTDEVLARASQEGDNVAGASAPRDQPLALYDQILEGLYQAILGRPADPAGREQCRAFLIAEGLGAGLPRLVELFLTGHEYRERLTAGVAENQPA